MKRLAALLLCLGLLLCGCDGVQPAQGSAGEQALYDALFDPASKISLNLKMAEEELAKMQADYDHYASRGSKSPIYRMADLEIILTAPDGTQQKYTIDQVGVRMKGNTSRTAFYNETDGIYNFIHLKISFQETFDDPAFYGAECLSWTQGQRQQRQSRTFAGLSKIDLRWNACDDTTYLRESYAYELYREFGVMAPRTNLCSFQWAGLHMGVYVLYEPVDNAFLEKRLPETQQGGDLYKLGWTNMGATFTKAESMGAEDKANGKFYIYDLKTNKTTSNHAHLKQLITALQNGTDKTELESLLDVDNFLRFAAVSWFLGNPDDLRNNYNNCYVYFTPAGKAMFIPYDYDRCLGVTRNWNPTSHGMTQESPYSQWAQGANNSQDNPLFRYTVCRGGLYTAEYTALLREFAGLEMLSPEAFQCRYAVAEALYGADTKPERQLRNGGNCRFAFDNTATDSPGGGNNLSYRDYVAAKLQTLEKAIEKQDWLPK